MRVTLLPPPYRVDRSSRRHPWPFFTAIGIYCVGCILAIYLIGRASFDPAAEREIPSILKHARDLRATAQRSLPANATEEERQAAKEMDRGRFFFPSDRELITESQMDAWDLETLQLVRDEILARHGFIFSDAEKNTYFSQKTWYKPNPDFNLSQLNTIERQNLETIDAYANRIEVLDNPSEKR